MQDERYKRNAKGADARPDPQLVNTVAAVIQVLQNNQNAQEPAQLAADELRSGNA